MTKTVRFKRWALRQLTPQGFRRWVWSAFRLFLIIGISYVILYPLLVKLSVSIMSVEDAQDMTVKWIAKHPTLDNFVTAFEKIHYLQYFNFTMIVTVICVVLQVGSCTLAAYGFAKFRFRGRGVLFALVIISLIVPPQTYIIPSYMQFRFFTFFGFGKVFGMAPVSLIGTPIPVFILSLGCQATKNGLFIYIMRQFFRSLPAELEEAADADGSGVFSTFFRIMLPNARPALITVSVFAFVWNYNDTYMSSTYMPTAKMFSTALSSLSSLVSNAMGGAQMDPVSFSILTNAAALLILLPLLILFAIAQKFFIEGVERTGIIG